MSPKTANTDYPILDLLQNRWSPRAFSSKPIAEETLYSLLEAARWAASCFNEQPWRFIIAKKENPEDYETLLSCLMEGNQAWAKTAPVLMISVAKLNFSHNNNPNRHAFHDVGAAVANLTVQAISEGIYVHQMGGFFIDKTRELYQIPDDYEPVAVLAIGYLGDASQLPDPMREREEAPRQRRTLSEFIYSGSWE